MIELTRRFDIKGECSGKLRIWNPNGTPHDFLGYFLHELGHSRPKGADMDSYYLCAQLLGISQSELTHIWYEIDRKESTNESIRQKILTVFGRNPI